MKWGTVPDARQDQNNANTDLSITYLLGLQSRVRLHDLWTAEGQDVFQFRLQKATAEEILCTHNLFFSILSLDESEGRLLHLHWKHIFPHISFLSNKAEFANPFYHITSLSFFTLTTHIWQGSAKFSS